MKVRWLYFVFLGMLFFWFFIWLRSGDVQGYQDEEKYTFIDNNSLMVEDTSHTHFFEGKSFSSLFTPVTNGLNVTTGKTFTIGIPFTFRAVGIGAKYLFRTIELILRPLTPNQRADVQIVLLNGEMNYMKHAHLFKHLMERFPAELRDGVIVVYSMTPDVYPEPLVSDPCQLRGFKGDSLSRVRWTSKLAWDTITLLDIGRTRGKYYLHLEDDTPPAEGNWYLTTLDLIENCKGSLKKGDSCVTSPWLMVFLNGVLPDRGLGGMFGLLFSSPELNSMVPWMKARYDLMPVDYLVGNYIFDHKMSTFTVTHPIINHEGKPKDSTKVGVDNKINFGEFDEVLSWAQCPKRQEMLLEEQKKGH